MTTTSPVPSADPSDLLFNAQKIDEAVTGTAPTYTDRLGVQRMTLAGAVARIAAINIRGAWATATAYAAKDVVSNAGTWYIAVDAHTSGATFAGDLSAHWRVFQGITAAELAAAAGAGLVGESFLSTYAAYTMGYALQAHGIVVPPGASLSSAVAALPSSGGVIRLKIGTYDSAWKTSGAMMTKKNVTIVGSGTPKLNATGTALEGGTIITGSFFFGADGFSVMNLGVDVGDDYCTASHAGVAQEGLVAPVSGTPAPFKGHYSDGIIVLCKKGTAAVHAYLLENYDGYLINRPTTRYGAAGVVVKSRNGVVVLHDGGAHYNYAGLAKSESNAVAKGQKWVCPIYRNVKDDTPNWASAGDYDTNGFWVQASTADAEDITVIGPTLDGCINPVYAQGLSGNVVRDVTVVSPVIRNSFAAPVTTSNDCERVRVLDMDSVSSGDGISIGVDSVDCEVSGHIEAPNGYGLNNYGTRTRAPHLLVKDPATGTAAVRNLSGSLLYGEVFLSSGTVTARFVVAGGSIISADGILNNGPDGWVQVLGNRNVVFSTDGSNAVSTNNAQHTLHVAAGRIGKAFTMATTSAEVATDFHNPNGLAGRITVNAATTSYGTTSDGRLKTLLAPLADQGAVIDAIQVYEGEYIADPGNRQPMFVAQQLAQHAPEAVTPGGDDPRMNPWMVDKEALMPRVIRELQALRARVAELEAKQ